MRERLVADPLIPALRIFDNFLPDAEALALRHRALAAEYAPFYTPGTRSVQVRRATLTALPSVILGIEEAMGRPVEPNYSGFRLDYDGELPNSAVHYDADVSSWAAVYYLNAPAQCRGGTAFWRHRETGHNAVPVNSSTEIQHAYRLDGNHATHWIMESVIGMRWNRCLIYPTSYFHSRYPIEGFGAGPPDGRLVAGIFFNLKGTTR